MHEGRENMKNEVLIIIAIIALIATVTLQATYDNTPKTAYNTIGTVAKTPNNMVEMMAGYHVDVMSGCGG